MRILPQNSCLKYSALVAAYLFSVFSVLTAVPNSKSKLGSYTQTPWVESDFPFFSSVLDCRKAGAISPGNNLTPRGVILRLSDDSWVCFDTDLLRVSAVWVGKGVSAKALAPLSYPDGKSKTPTGQKQLPVPLGELWMTSGIYPGWQKAEQLSTLDPRTPAPSPEEVGKGPIPASLGQFKAIEEVEGGVVLNYTVSGVTVHDWWTTKGDSLNKKIQRHVILAACDHTLLLVLGTKKEEITFAISGSAKDTASIELKDEASVSYALIKPHSTELSFTVSLSNVANTESATDVENLKIPRPLNKPHWAQEVTSEIKRSADKDAYVVDDIVLPTANPWNRKVRPCDVQFFKNGDAVIVTFDGDVWLAKGLDQAQGVATWKRFASGLHEPMSLALRDEEIFVLDKNGIWKLSDPQHLGEATRYELFSNAFAQTADMREFATAIRLAPDRSFVIAKGGQQGTTLGKHNGSILRVSADGTRSEVLGYGFRQPNLGVNPKTGLVTGSDQEGDYIPSTPIHVIGDNKFYGYLAGFLPKEVYPAAIEEPLTWMPHSVSASAMGQEWLMDSNMGPLNNELVHLAFDRPELYRVILNARNPRLQASVVTITQQFDFPLMHGSVNPKDGYFYVTGFQVIGWGNVIDTEGGLGRVRYTGLPSTLPSEVVPATQGILIRFDSSLDTQSALDASNYAVQAWHYLRTSKYGSPEYKSNGVPGHDRLPVSAAYLSKDEKSVFIAIPGMKPVMQLQVSYDLKLKQGRSFLGRIYTTPYQLIDFNPIKEGFSPLNVDLTLKPIVESNTKKASVEEGKQLSERYGCIACHTVDASNTPKPGPSWFKLYGKTIDVYADSKKATIVADEGYIRESIVLPAAKYAAGYEKSEIVMPSFAGILSDEQVDSIVRYIKTLK